LDPGNALELTLDEDFTISAVEIFDFEIELREMAMHIAPLMGNDLERPFMELGRA
jgi:hypothetical protein